MLKNSVILWNARYVPLLRTASNCTGDNSTIRKGPKNNRKVPVRMAVGENCFKEIVIKASSF